MLCLVQFSFHFFLAHDFFLPQPVKDADVFLLRQITHEWSDEKTIQILQRLCDAAKPTTHLVLIEHIVPSVVEEPTSIKAIPGALRPTAPAPLLPNFGVASSAIYFRDMLVRHFWHLSCTGEYEISDDLGRCTIWAGRRGPSQISLMCLIRQAGGWSESIESPGLSSVILLVFRREVLVGS
jgi:hypothetical protein